MDYKIIDNALPKKEFDNIKNNILDPFFPWHLANQITNDKEDLPTYASFYFSHMFWSGFDIEPASQMFAPLLKLMDCNAIMRIKANCYLSTPERIIHDSHFDNPFSKGAIFYLNTNNGLTILEDKVEVESIENRLLLFDSTKMHASTTCTDTQCRINVNFNYF